MGFGWTESDFGYIPTEPTTANQTVVLFLHVPKCAGTAVRGIFRNGIWHRTHWSLSNRPTGVWHSNRLLKAIHDALKQGRRKIFAEWHVELNFSFVPELERYVKAMRPDVRFHSFTILRKPEDLATHNAAFWMPTMPANLSLMLDPEKLLFDTVILNISSLLHEEHEPHDPREQGLSHRRDALGAEAPAGAFEPMSPSHAAVCSHSSRTGSLADGFEPAGLCEQAYEFEASKHFNNITRKWEFESLASTRAALRRGTRAITDEIRARAHARLQLAQAQRMLIWRAGSCDPLVRAGLRRLAPVHHVLLLEQNTTFPIIHALARGDLSFTPPPAERLAPRVGVIIGVTREATSAGWLEVSYQGRPLLW